MEERFDFAIRWLKKNGQIKNAQEVAEKIGMSAANLSAAKNGRLSAEACLQVLNRINAAYGSPFAAKWINTGEGDMVVADIVQTGNGNHAANIRGNNTQTNMPDKFAEILSCSQKQIDKLLDQQAEFLRIITNLSSK